MSLVKPFVEKKAPFWFGVQPRNKIALVLGKKPGVQQETAGDDEFPCYEDAKKRCVHCLSEIVGPDQKRERTN